MKAEYSKECINCLNPFTSSRKDSKYCSTNCRVQANRKTKPVTPVTKIVTPVTKIVTPVTETVTQNVTGVTVNPYQEILEHLKLENDFLKGQVIEKDKQIREQSAHVAQLIERTREQNNIIFALEQGKQQLEARIPRTAEPRPVAEPPEPVNYGLIAFLVLAVGIILLAFYMFILA